MLTYVDTAGDFHVVQRPADVPIDARDQVRVVVTTREDGTGDQVYVADLRARQPDGTYAVRTMSRAQWDELGATRRKARLEALVPPPSAAVSAQPPVAGSAARREVPVVAVIYGAEWCKPCHDAARYLKSRGVTVIEKDIESSDAVKQEMDRKLERAKLNGASIPIIDVGGRLLIGFSPQALDRAVEAARSRRTL
ncbi:MAG: NrdH-redoxin [Polyangiaceae bacterium]|nr:NrdH-redoxin [Polyangiaceae bacterium]